MLHLVGEIECELVETLEDPLSFRQKAAKITKAATAQSRVAVQHMKHNWMTDCVVEDYHSCLLK